MKKDDTIELFDIQATNVISLEKKRREFLKERCKHNKLIVDEGLAMLTCGDCGEQLDPMWILARMAKKEETLQRKLYQQYVRLCNIEAAVRRKVRTKCKHCGRVTPVNIKMSDGEWMGWNKINDKNR
jgi:uncharacterized Zn finger protein